MARVVINVNVIAGVTATIMFENNHQVLQDDVTCNKNAIVAGTLQTNKRELRLYALRNESEGWKAGTVMTDATCCSP